MTEKTFELYYGKAFVRAVIVHRDGPAVMMKVVYSDSPRIIRAGQVFMSNSEDLGL